MKRIVLFSIFISAIFLISSNENFAFASSHDTHNGKSINQDSGIHHMPHQGICAPGFVPLGEICVLNDRCGPGVYPGKVCVLDGIEQPYLRPHHQKYAGLSANNIICAEGKTLMFKSHDSSPACVNSDSVTKLLQRGWQEEKPVLACTLEFDPICGLDGVTYGNKCMMLVEHMVMKHAGECGMEPVSNFEECMAAGNPIMESFPRQCQSPDGQTFVEEINVGESEGVFPSALMYTEKIPAIDESKGYFVEEIADGIYWLIGSGYQVMFLTTGEGVIVVDAPQPIGEKYLQAIDEVTDEPITHMIYSHSHPDHTGMAGQIFPKDIEYIAHQDTADILISENDPNRPIPTVTFEDTYTLTVGNQVLELSYIGPFHSEGDVVILAPRQKVAMAVDLFHPGAAPYRAFGVTVNMDAHIEAHDTLVEDFDFDVLISGHEQILANKDHIKTDKEFIYSMMEITEQAIQSVVPSEVIGTCVVNTIAEWEGKLRDLENFMEEHCIAMQDYMSSQ